MRAVRRALLVAAVVVAAAGCSLLTSVDGLSGAVADLGDSGALPSPDGDAAAGASLEDATVHPADGGADARLDGAASAVDASETGATQADAAVDAGPLSYCAKLATPPAFCDDFDESLLVSGWDSVGAKRGTVSIAGPPAQSIPFVLKSAVDPVTSGLVDVAAYKKLAALAGKPYVLSFAFDLYVEAGDTTHGADAVIGALDLLGASNEVYELQLDVVLAGGKAAVRFPEYSTPGDGGPQGYVGHAVSAPLTLQKWTRVTIELTLTTPGGGSNNSARLLFDGVPVSASPVNVTVAKGVPQLVMGVSYVQAPSDAWTVRYDNVTLEARAL